jgi:hypothetical protein
MNLKEFRRRGDVLSVPVDERSVLIDQQLDRVHVVNRAGAWVWAHLGSATPLSVPFVAAVSVFIAALSSAGLLAEADARHTSDVAAAPDEELTEAPRLLATVPLQVAANNSAPSSDPFWEDIG